MKRREFITLLGGAAVSWPMVARAQQPSKVRRIGLFVPGTSETHGQYVAIFRKTLSEFGYEEARNYVLDLRWGGGNISDFNGYAKELVAATPDVILATGSPVLAALTRETNSVPIVFVQVADPVGGGFVAGLAHPGGNVTGFTNAEPAMVGKWVELLKEIAPGINRIALVYSPQGASAGGSYFLKSFEDAAHSIGVKPIKAAVNGPTEIENAIGTLARDPNGSFVVIPDGLTLVHRELLLKLAARHKTPAIYPFREFVTRGGLISYGADIVGQYERAAAYVDRILKGEKPAGLPVQAPTKFELVINLNSAKMLGLAIPPALLARADEVIE